MLKSVVLITLMSATEGFHTTGMRVRTPLRIEASLEEENTMLKADPEVSFKTQRRSSDARFAHRLATIFPIHILL